MAGRVVSQEVGAAMATAEAYWVGRVEGRRWLRRRRIDVRAGDEFHNAPCATRTSTGPSLPVCFTVYCQDAKAVLQGE